MFENKFEIFLIIFVKCFKKTNGTKHGVHDQDSCLDVKINLYIYMAQMLTGMW